MFFKRYQLLTFFLGFTPLIHAMDRASVASATATPWTGPVIVTPYKPSFISRSIPYAMPAFKYGCLGAAAFFVFKKQTTLAASLSAINLTAAYAQKQACIRKLLTPKWSLDTVLLDPASALNKMNEKAEQARKEMLEEGLEEAEVPKLIDEYRRITRKYEASCPIHLLGECTKEGFGACLLSRSYQPLYRNHFENKTVAALLQKSCEHEHQPIEYVGFGTGGSFQDFVIVLKALVQKPNLAMSIHLIDREFTPYVFCREAESNSRLICHNQATNFLKLLPEIIAKVRTEKWVDEKSSDNQASRLIIGHCLKKEEAMRLFISYLTKTFPRAQLSLHVHESAQSYLDYIKQHRLNPADVVAAADIQDEMSICSGSQKDYLLLCKETLLHNPSAINFLLSKINNETQGGITEVALNHKPGFERLEEASSQSPANFYRDQPIETTGFLTRMLTLIKNKALALVHLKCN